VNKPLTYLGFYGIITELGNLDEIDEEGEVEINYLKKIYVRGVTIEKYLDSRMICELKYIEAAIDGRSSLTIRNNSNITFFDGLFMPV